MPSVAKGRQAVSSGLTLMLTMQILTTNAIAIAIIISMFIIRIIISNTSNMIDNSVCYKYD